jgi:protein TonB
MPIFLLLAAQAAAAGPPAAPPPPVRAQALANLASYVEGGDMPAAVAAQGRLDARVHFELAIDPRGRVTACRITASGGIAALDAATCRIMRARARFRPARDAAGNAVADTAASSIRWFLP